PRPPQDRQDGNNVSVANNTPNPPGQDAGGSNGSSSQNGRTEEITNYEISKTVRTEVKAGGEVKRISAAVLVDGVTTVAEDGTKTYAARTPEELKQVDALVKSAIGFDEKRGDVVTITNMKFAEPEIAEDGGMLLGF